MKITPITERVRKLLAIADNESATEAERELAEAQAKRLIEQHDIDVLRDLNETSPDIFITAHLRYTQRYELLLAHAAATRAGAKVHYSARLKRITVFGTEAQTYLTEALFERWCAHLTIDIRHDKHRLHGRSDYSTYRLSWAAKVVNRVTALMATPAEAPGTELAEAPGTELVLLQTKQEEAYAEAFPNLRRGRSFTARGSSAAAAAGSAAGERAQLSYGVNTRPTTAGALR